jgi:hypothetical protein
MRKKKTAIELLIQHFKKLERVSRDIDEEQSYFYKIAAETAEFYLKKEKTQITRAYTDGKLHMALGNYFYSPDYFLDMYGKAQ